MKLSIPHRAALFAQGGTAAPPPELALVGSADSVGLNSTTRVLSLSGTLTGGLAASPAPGDLVLAVVAFGIFNNDRVLSVTGDNSGAYTRLGDELFSADARAINMAVFAQVMGATPDTQITGANYGTSSTYGGVLTAVVLRNQAATYEDAATTSAIGGNSTRSNPPAITPVTAGSWVFAIGGGAITQNKTAQPSFAGFTTIRYSNYNASSCSTKLLIAYQPWSGSGAVDPPIWTDADPDDVDSAWAALTVAIRPTT
jgi:hypothetical protein